MGRIVAALVGAVLGCALGVAGYLALESTVHVEGPPPPAGLPALGTPVAAILTAFGGLILGYVLWPQAKK